MPIKRLQPVVDATGLDKVGGPEVVKKNMMPSSFAGGLRCMTEDFQDAVAVSRVHGSPDIFTTFACDPEWPKIIETLEHGQKAVDRADITIQIHQMKLLDYLHTIRTGQVFGTVLAVVHTVEFQKTGCPMHISLFGRRRTMIRALHLLMLIQMLVLLHLPTARKRRLLSQLGLTGLPLLLLLHQPFHKTMIGP